MSEGSEEIELRGLLVRACRILASTGLAREVTGHVSVRLPKTEDVLVRCRSEDDPGVLFTRAQDIRRVSLERGAVALSEGYSLPGEWSIHREIYLARPDVNAIVHGHPRSSLICGILRLPLEPVFGAYDPDAAELAVLGVPVYPRAVLISNSHLGRELAAALGDSNVCLLAGHGIVTVGRGIEDALVRAIKLETLADVTLQAHLVGRPLPVVDPLDIEEVLAFVAPRSHVHRRWTWDYYDRLSEMGSGVDGGGWC